MNNYTLNPRPESRLRTLRRSLVRCLAFLLLGAAANVVVAYALGLFVDVSQGRTESAGAWSGQSQWTVTRWSRRGATYLLSVREPGGNWSPGQATGPPDTPTGGDQVTAWASQSPDNQAEWLLLDYAEPVVARAVRVYEIYGTGAVDKVTVFDPAGKPVVAWHGVDPTPKGSRIGMSEIPLKPLGFPVKRIRIHLDSVNTPNWNEIDAVGLVDANDKVHWAVGAEASSTYASSSLGGLSLAGGGAAALAPQWSGLHTPSDDLVHYRVRREERGVDARGWPMLSLWGNVPTARVTQQVTGGATISAIASGLIISRSGAPAGTPVPGETPLLIHPIWRGFMVNSAFYAVLLAMTFWAMTVPRRFVREVARMRRGACVACGYDLGFDFIPGCPECGWRRERVSNDQ